MGLLLLDSKDLYRLNYRRKWNKGLGWILQSEMQRKKRPMSRAGCRKKISIRLYIKSEQYCRDWNPLPQFWPSLHSHIVIIQSSKILIMLEKLEVDIKCTLQSFEKFNVMVRSGFNGFWMPWWIFHTFVRYRIYTKIKLSLYFSDLEKEFGSYLFLH